MSPRKPKPGTVHPVYRCDRCHYWEHRNGGPPPLCPFCDSWRDERGKRKIQHPPMAATVRFAPVELVDDYEA